MPPENTPVETSAAASLLVYTAFFLTGVGLVLPGAMLPLLLRRWAIGDARGGLLLFLFFIGSMLGAVASRGSLARSFARGAAVTASGALALAVVSRTSAFAAMALYGLGLGIVMTSSSLMQARRRAHERTAEMAKLNFLWAVGACAGPGLALHFAAIYGPGGVLTVAGAVFAVIAGLGVLVPKSSVPGAQETESATNVRGGSGSGALPLLLLLVLIPFSTGIESSTGGWLTTYTRRAGEGLGGIIGAVTCFWAGMLLSRLLHSNRAFAARLQSPWLIGGPALMTAALALMLTAHKGLPVTLAALLLGLAIGPMYPLLLALALDHDEFGNFAFVIAGCGAALLPLLTGLISAATGSLRAGLAVPLAGAALMLLLTTGARVLAGRSVAAEPGVL